MSERGKPIGMNQINEIAKKYMRDMWEEQTHFVYERIMDKDLTPERLARRQEYARWFYDWSNKINWNRLLFPSWWRVRYEWRVLKMRFRDAWEAFHDGATDVG